VKTLRELREERGISPMRLALDLDVSLATVYNWETGRSEPRATHLRKLAELLGVCMEEISFDEELVKKAAARDSLAAA
jgi:transcriptional regulator with XRE-family HTH domain